MSNVKAHKILSVLVPALLLASGCQFNAIKQQISSARTASLANKIAAPSFVIKGKPGLILIPGNGFTGATAQPAKVGAGPASTQNAIARWDVVPFQTFDKTMNIGVVAFHINGIDRVEFSVNGGAWAAVGDASINPETGVNEYWATLDASKFANDGAVEVRAIIYPKAGVPRVLQGGTGLAYDFGTGGIWSLMLNSNANHTLTQAVRYVATTGDDLNGDGSQARPFASIKRAANDLGPLVEGGTIYLAAGSYLVETPNGQFGVNTNRWLTISAAPGLTRDQVVITGSAGGSGLYTKLVKFSNLSVTGNIDGNWVFYNQGWVSGIWYDGCANIGSDRFASQGVWGINGARGYNFKFATRCTIDTVDDGFDTFDLVRDSTINHVATGYWRNVGMVLNSTGDDINADGHPNIHSDSLQHSLTMQNTIYYGCQATHGAFIRLTTVVGQVETDMAMVDCTFTGVFPYAWEMGSTNTNLYIKNTTFSPGFSEYSLVANDIVFEGCTFNGLPPSVPGLTIR